MTDVSTPEGLLEIAVDAMRRDILPALDGDRRFTGLMIANAMSIAQRQCAASRDGEEPAVTEFRADIERRLSGSASESAPSGTDADPASVATLLHELANAIRSGTADPGRPLHEPLHAYLVDQVHRELQVVNPRYLARR